jgi:cytochrome P450
MTNYLALIDAAPEAEKFALAYNWMWHEPLPFFKQLREKRPILVTPQATIISRFDDVTNVLNMPTVFTVELYLPKMGDGIYLMAHDDDALHTREKSIMQSLLNRNDLPAVRNMVGNIAKEILDAANGEIDIVNAFCRGVPAGLVQDYFGLNGIEKSKLIEWSYWNQYNAFHNQPFDPITPEKAKYIDDQQKEASKMLGIYVAQLLARRLFSIKLENANVIAKFWYGILHLLNLLEHKPEPLRDDIVTRMMRNHFPYAMELDFKRLAVNAGGLLIGAIETTSQAVAQALQFLLQHPEYLAQAQAAAQLEDTTQFDGIVWEVMRYVPIAPYLFRKSASEYTVGMGSDYAVTLPAGSIILAATQSAMFDPGAFENPEAFIPSRNWYHYFHFGFGSHECMGKYVGMVMIPEMIRQVMLRNNLQASGNIDYKDGPFPEAYHLRWG